MAKYTAADLRKMLAEAEAAEGKYTDLREKIDALCEKAGTTLAEVLKATGNPAQSTMRAKYRFEGVEWSGQGAYPPAKWSLFNIKTNDKGKLGIYYKDGIVSVQAAKELLEKLGHTIEADGLTKAEKKAKGKGKADAYTPVE